MTRWYRPRRPPRGGRAAVNRRWHAECGTASDAGSDRTDRSTRARVDPPDADPRLAVPRRCISPGTPCCVLAVAGFYPPLSLGACPFCGSAFADRVRFSPPLILGAFALATGRLPSFVWLGICRPCAVSPPLILGALALATGRLPSFLWLGICRPCAVPPPLILGALAHATGRLPSF